MFTREGIRTLHGWTHDSLDVIVGHAGSLPSELLVREIPGFALPSLRHQLVHILSWEATWVCNLRGVAASVLAPDDYPDLTSLIEAKRRVVGATTAYLDQVTETAFNAELPSPPSDWVGPLRSPAFILLHVVTHAFHHKGQMAAIFRLLGHPAPDSDLQR